MVPSLLSSVSSAGSAPKQELEREESFTQKEVECRNLTGGPMFRIPTHASLTFEGDGR
jgi:hypothetical protein